MKITTLISICTFHTTLKSIMNGMQVRSIQQINYDSRLYVASQSINAIKLLTGMQHVLLCSIDIYWLNWEYRTIGKSSLPLRVQNHNLKCTIVIMQLQVIFTSLFGLWPLKQWTESSKQDLKFSQQWWYWRVRSPGTQSCIVHWKLTSI
jgi:hypothetical protein